MGEEALQMYGLVPVGRRGTTVIGQRYPGILDAFDDFFSDGFMPVRLANASTFRLDVQDNDGGYVVEAELPGVARDDIDVELRDGQLTIGVTREEKIDETGKNYVHRERRMSSMTRGLYLADAVNEGVEARLEDGVLTVKIPKATRDTGATRVAVS